MAKKVVKTKDYVFMFDDNAPIHILIKEGVLSTNETVYNEHYYDILGYFITKKYINKVVLLISGSNDYDIRSTYSFGLNQPSIQIITIDINNEYDFNCLEYHIEDIINSLEIPKTSTGFLKWHVKQCISTLSTIYSSFDFFNIQIKSFVSSRSETVNLVYLANEILCHHFFRDINNNKTPIIDAIRYKVFYNTIDRFTQYYTCIHETYKQNSCCLVFESPYINDYYLVFNIYSGNYTSPTIKFIKKGIIPISEMVKNVSGYDIIKLNSFVSIWDSISSSSKFTIVLDYLVEFIEQNMNKNGNIIYDDIKKFRYDLIAFIDLNYSKSFLSKLYNIRMKKVSLKGPDNINNMFAFELVNE